MRPRVNTKKHLVQASLATVAGGAVAVFSIIDAKTAPAAAQPDEVTEGAIISAVYVEMWISSDDAAQGTCIVTLEKRPSGLVAMTAAESAALNLYENKKNILHTFMGLVPTNVQYPMTAIKGWVKIPKGKQRFGIADKLILNIHGQSNGANFCGFAIYKEQF